MKKWLQYALPAAALVGLLSINVAVAADSGDYAKVYQSAQSAQKKATSRACAWNVTDDALDQAAKLKHRGKAGAALKKARHAEALAKLSMKQCEEQKTAWKQAVVK